MAPESAWLPGEADDAGFRVLFVCTGNICRSPMAEAFARRELGNYPGAGLSFASAGSHALEGNPATQPGVVAVADRGGDLASHRARELSRRRVRDADLILVMASEHLPYVLAFDRSAADRAFVLGAFARALPDLAEAARSPEQLVAIAARRLRVRDGDDVEDPIGASPEVYADCAEQIDELVTPVVAALAKLA
jgi:protein-tyrosine phosphatase